MAKLLGLGDNTVDTYVDQGLQFPGGNAVNVAALSARLGARTGYLGCLGDDEAGDLLHTAMTAEHVDLSRCRRRPGANARAFIGHRDGDRYFIGSQPGVRGQYGWIEADFDYIRGFGLVHTSIYSELDEHALQRIKRSAPLLSFDFSERWNDAARARTLPFVDLAFLSWPAGSDAECEALLRSCAAQGVKIAVITRGARGAMALAEKRVKTQPISPAAVVDTLGAGDGFIAAFLVAHLAGMDLAEMLAAAASNAARVCGYRGAFGHGAPWAGDQAKRSDQPLHPARGTLQ